MNLIAAVDVYKGAAVFEAGVTSMSMRFLMPNDLSALVNIVGSSE
jgi:hypothetical protein